MKRFIVLGSAFLFLGSISGCGGESRDSILKDMIQQVKKAGSILGEIKAAKDPAKEAEKRAPELREVGERLRDLKNKAAALKEPLDDAEKKRLREEFGKQLTKAIDDTSKAWNDVKDLPKVRKALDEKKALEFFGFGG